MNDDERRRPIERIVQTVVFAMVAVVVITSVALPILATMLSRDGVQGTPIGTMIGIIPILLIISIVVWIANRMRGSDR